MNTFDDNSYRMFARYQRIFSLILVLFSLAACNRKSVVLEYTNANKEVAPLQNLVFRFNKNLAADSLLNRWDSSAYISFEPAIPGKFRWEQGNVLVFSPAHPLLPATAYSAKLNKLLVEGTEFNSIEKTDKIEFYTPELQIEETNSSWTLPNGAGSAPVPQVDLYFNYKVDAAALKEKLQVKQAGKDLSFSLVTAGKDSKQSIRINGIQPADKDMEFTVAIAKGMLPDGGNQGLSTAISQSVTLSSPFVLTINGVTMEHDGSAGTILVRTSQLVNTSNWKNYIQVTPAVPLKLEATEDGFLLTGTGFDAEKVYQLIFKKGLKGVLGGELKEEHTESVAFGKLEPAIRFVNGRAGYLSAKGARNIEVKIVNVPRVKLVVSKIYESNLLAANRYGYYPAERTGEQEYYYEGDGDFTLGDIIYEKEIDTRSLPRSGGGNLLQFNLEDHVEELKGAYHIKLRSTDDYWIADSRMFSLSDIGLIVKSGNEQLTIWANSIASATAVSGVNVVAYGANNQVLGMAATNADGVAEVNYAKKDVAGFAPALVVAKTANDFNYILFSNTRVNTSRFEVGGKQLNSAGLDAYVYTERGIYRPGEKVNLAVILRDQFWKPVEGLPIRCRVLLPTGKELKQFRKNLNEQGSMDASVDLPVAAITGTYQIEIYSGTDILLASHAVQVEEFVPDRIRVQTRLGTDELQPGSTTQLGIDAQSFFGPPAANRAFETEIQVKQLAFRPKKYRQYEFALVNQNSFHDKKLIEGKTDENGHAVVPYTVPDFYKNIGSLQAAFFATVFDETGRPVSKTARATIYTQSAFLGIGSTGYNYFPLNQPVKFPLIALNKSEQVVNGQPAKVEVIKTEYRTVLRKSSDYFRYESQQEEKIVASSTVTVSGEQSNYSFVPRSPGNYQIRLSIPGSSTYVSQSFYSYGSWGGDYNSFDVNTDGNIDIETDKAVYAPGEKAKLLFKTPFSGRMLVTIEQNKVLQHHYLQVEKRSGVFELPIDESHLPNVFVTATLIKPHEVSDIPLTVAHGFKNITVSDKRRSIPVEIIAEASSRSKQKQQVRVKAIPGAMVTLAAVDNGVLQVTDFKTPDPYQYFYAARALGVYAFDLYPLLFPELKAIRSSTGGDGDLRMDQRVNPMPNKRVKVVSYWSGLVKTNSSGEASFTVEIPAFSGEIRLMAVAHKDNRFGSAEKAMKVTDPLVLSTALPRFMSPGDSLSVPVTISNTTNQAINGKASVKVTGALNAPDQSTSITVSANSEQRVVFTVGAQNTIGTGIVTVDVAAGGSNYNEVIDITVRPASTLQKRSGGGQINAGASVTLAVGDPDFIASSVRKKLVISRSPVLEMGNLLQQLVNYPYGCTEQAVSSAFPQLYFTELSELLQKGDASRKAAAANVLEAIRKIKMRQLYTGAVTLWDDQRTENWWTTIYAAHFLLEARKVGFEVEKSLLETMLSYINQRLSTHSTITYTYNGNQQKKIIPKETAYSLYVLALAGKPNIASMNYHKSRPEQLSIDSKYLLSAAYALAGDKSRFAELLPGSFTGEESVPATGGSFYSALRDEAIALNALIDINPSHPQVGTMARSLAQRLKQQSWYSTQESAFSLLALGKLAAKSGTAKGRATVISNGKTLGKMENTSLVLDATALKTSQNLQVQATDGPVFYWWEAEGISASGAYVEEDKYLKIRRNYFDRNGKPISGKTFRQNDLVVVQLVLDKAYSGTIENIVLTDLLPAGFEIENPRTKDIPGMDWIKDAATPTAMDIRDDRLHYFVDAYSNRQVYYYAVRAVSPGVFKQGPVSADAMYNHDYHSYHGAGSITVTSR